MTAKKINSQNSKYSNPESLSDEELDRQIRALKQQEASIIQTLNNLPKPFKRLAKARKQIKF